MTMSARPSSRGSRILPNSTRVVLPVAVDLHGNVEATLKRVEVARLHRAADPEVERKSQHLGSGFEGPLRRLVRRAVVDDHHLEVWVEASDLGDDRRDRLGLVERRDNGHAAYACKAVVGSGDCRPHHRFCIGLARRV